MWKTFFIHFQLKYHTHEHREKRIIDLIFQWNSSQEFLDDIFIKFIQTDTKMLTRPRNEMKPLRIVQCLQSDSILQWNHSDSAPYLVSAHLLVQLCLIEGENGGYIIGSVVSEPLQW